MAIAAPNVDQVNDRVNALWRSIGGFISKSDLRARILRKQLAPLLRSEPVSAYVLLANVAALTGDETEARAHLTKALRLRRDPLVLMSSAGVLGNLGYFSEATEYFRDALVAETLVFAETAEKAIANASIMAFDEALIRVGNMPIPVAPRLRERIVRAAEVFRRCDVSDEQIAGCADVAGTLMRERGLIFLRYPELYVTSEEEFQQVDLGYFVDLDSSQVADLNATLVTATYDNGIHWPDCLSIRFLSRPAVDERIAA